MNLKQHVHINKPHSFFLLLIFINMATVCPGAPAANDDCKAATAIVIPNNGFGLGTFTSVQTDLTQATLQAGETFAPAIFVAALDKKSVWFKFSIPTIRAVRVTLTQPGTAITAGDAGFTVYQTANCLPGNTDISSKLTPIVTFGNTYHPCVPSGDYVIQVSANTNANGPITIQLEISDQTGAAYDHPDQAYAFGTVGYYAHKIDFNTECQSIEDASESCTAFVKPTDYNKTAWLTFTTPAYFDYIVVQLSGTGTSSYFPSNNGAATNRKFGYTLYKGNAVSTPIGSLQTIDGCDSLESNGYYAGYKMYKCDELERNTTYSIQLFIHKDFGDDVRMGILVGGQSPTNAPKPILSAVPVPNAIGNLPFSPAGVLTQKNDVWGCNSRHSTSVCNPSLPDTGIVYGGAKYNLSSFFTFSLAGTCGIYFDVYSTQCGPYPLVRIFRQGLTNSCAALDTTNIAGTFLRNGFIDCLASGNYTVQVSGQDPTDWYGKFTYGTPTQNYEQCVSNNLGTAFLLNMTAYYRKAANKYSLNSAGAFDTINRVGNTIQALTANIGYSAVSDTMGCASTLRPADTTCSPLNNKVMYRKFEVGDSGIADFSNLVSVYTGWRYRLYSGDANALASAQNVFAFPDKITGLVPKSECFDGYVSCANKTVCVTPGTYTLTTMGSESDVGREDKPVITFVRLRTKHKTPFTAQNLGNLWDSLGAGGGTIQTDADVFDCDDNAEAISGYTPCSINGLPATKAIYRQFYLKENTLVKIDVPYYYYCANRAFGFKTLFYGKAADGLAGLSPVGNGWDCFQYGAGSTAGCNLLPAGWYTVVSYNQGPGYNNTTRSINLEGRYNSSVSYYDEFKITITPTCKGPQYNRPYKASVNSSNQPHAIELITRNGHTAAYPRTDSTYVLPTEYFNCTLDTPFILHPVQPCINTANRVAYYVFKTTAEAYLQINAGGYYAALYNKDVRKDSALFASLIPFQACSNGAGYIQFCNFQPGTYTLVIFAGDGNICQSVTPSILIDETNKYARFDYAKNAYDFGTVPPDAVYHYGKTGDVNPLNSGRKASHDFFYCTTGASNTDPAEPVCNTKLNPNVYNSGPDKPLFDSAFPASNGVARRNLWYTFVADQPGYVKVKVDNKHDLRGYQPRFAVYKSNADGTLPFSTIVSTGQVDSTIAQGLQYIGANTQTYYYCANFTNDMTFYRDPCSSVTTRYYILVENVNAEPYESGGTLLNTQVEVAVSIDSVTLVLPKHDHYSLAGNIGDVGVGKYTGDTDNYSCATKDATDPVYYYGGSSQCQKTLWYKFTSTITGNVRYRAYINGVRKQDYYDVQLFRQTIPGDSTSSGLAIQGNSIYYDSDNTYWAQTCVSPGTYYLLLPGCDQINSNVYPEIELVENEGDFCSRAVAAAINGAGAVTTSVLVNCHTVGTDYGEFAPTITCPQGAVTSEYKTSWFRMDIGGTDTLDVTAYLVENTNAASSDIKYRLMTGDCGAMQEQSCVLDALTQNTYQCLAPGQSYYVQVFTPLTKYNQAVTGTIDLKLSAITHADTCAPLTNCLANSNFTALFNCNTDDSVKFANFSTYGTSIKYKWDFGYNGKSSTDISPSFFYPALASDKNYAVKLLVENISCGKKDSITKTITIPGRPFIDFGNDMARCDGSPVTLNAASHTGAAYLWNDGSTGDTLKVTAAGKNEYWVKINYNGCSSNDTVKVVVSPIAAKRLQQIVLCSDSVAISAGRGLGETYTWSNGATTSSIYASKTGVYWADIKYFSCTYRDSFNVNNAAASRPLGNDTTVCISASGYVLRATAAGAQSYTWQNGTAADTLKVTAPGQYNVSINFGSCTIQDTVDIAGYPAPLVQNIDTSICFGQTFKLLSGKIVSTAGIYLDSIRYPAGCDSLIRKLTLTINPKPDLGKDITVCFAKNGLQLDASIANAVSYKWQDGTGNASYNVLSPGLYWVTINFGKCSTGDTINVSATAPPVKKITDTSICFGQSLALLWGVNANTAGIYTDTVLSAAGCDSLIQIVNLTLKSGLSLGNDTAIAICSGTPVNLTALYNFTGLTAAWSKNNTAVNNPAAVNTAGVYKLIAATAQGCSDTVLLTLTVSPKPALGADSIINICTGNTFNLNAVFNIPGNSTTWTLNSTPVINPASINTMGVYEVISASINRCADTAFLTLNVTSKPVLTINNPAIACLPQTIDLTANAITVGSPAGLVFTYWKDAAATIAYSNAPASANGTFFIKGTAAAGCFDIKPVTVMYYPLPVVNAGNNITICDKDSAVLSATVSNITAPVTYAWEPVTAGGIINAAAAATVVKPAATQQYILTVRDGYGCSYEIKDTITVTMQAPVAAFAGNDTVAVIGVPHQLQASGGTKYTWSPASLLDNPFTANPFAKLSADTRFTVEVRDAAGCIGYDTMFVKTLTGITFYIPNAFSPNGDGINEFFNPTASGIRSMDWFRVFNRYGQIMFETTEAGKGWNGMYKGKQQPAGNYVWHVRGTTIQGRIIELKGNAVLIR